MLVDDLNLTSTYYEHIKYEKKILKQKRFLF